MLADFEHHMKNIEDDVNLKSRNPNDIIDSDLKLSFQTFDVSIVSVKRMK